VARGTRLRLSPHQRQEEPVKAKEKEQVERHLKFNNTEYNLEPDIKSSPGGLRDIHTIDWLLSNYSRKSQTHGINLLEVVTPYERKDLNKAKEWYTKGAAQGHEKAQCQVDKIVWLLAHCQRDKTLEERRQRNQIINKEKLRVGACDLGSYNGTS
jgi:hypothetical protein